MNKKAKAWLIVAGCLIIAGSILFTAALMANDWDFSKLGTAKYETNTYTPDGAFSKIHIYTEEADVTLIPSESNICTVVCHEQENAQHVVDLQNDALYVRIRNDKKWYEYIGINFGTPKITISLPQNAYDALFVYTDTGDVEIPEDFQFDTLDISVSTGDVTSRASVDDSLKIATSTGNIRLENITAKKISLTVSTGNTYLTNVDCESLNTSGSTGHITLKNVIVAGIMSVERSTGDVKLDGCDAGEIYVKTSTGDVTGTLLSEKIFVTKTSTGKVNVPQSASGGKCTITTSTGDINITLG